MSDLSKESLLISSFLSVGGHKQGVPHCLPCALVRSGTPFCGKKWIPISPDGGGRSTGPGNKSLVWRAKGLASFSFSGKEKVKKGSC